MLERVKTIAEGEPYPQHLGIKLVESAQDRAVLCLPYRACLGLDRMHRGAISSLVHIRISTLTRAARPSASQSTFCAKRRRST